jgi:large subunit ribosomal protein L3
VLKPSEVFEAKLPVDVVGTSKGKGYQGVIKKHHMKGMKATHGTHEYFRHGGSIGNRSYPGRVFKGKRMAGRLGNARVTVSNLRVVEVRVDDGLLFIHGAVPGACGATIVIRKHRGPARAPRGEASKPEKKGGQK